MTPTPAFDVDEFLAQPLVARVATNGPTIRPVWFLWERGAFWWLTGTWSRLGGLLAADPQVALTVDTCDLTGGTVRQVIAKGPAEIHPYDRDRARRKLARYLGPDPATWDERFVPDTMTDAAFVRLVPTSLVARDLSFEPSVPTSAPP